MRPEYQPPEVTIPESYLKYYGAVIVITGDVPKYDSKELTTGTLVWSVVLELLNNCVENRQPESSVGAKNINVIFEAGKVTVEDDFVYEKPEDILNRILQIRNSGKPKTTKSFEDGLPSGGAGIYTSTKTLRELGGNLDYHIQDGTIVAVGTWNTEKV